MRSGLMSRPDGLGSMDGPELARSRAVLNAALNADYERAWNLLRVRLVERFQMASEALKREGLDYAARLVPIEEVLVWMDEEEEAMERTDG